MISFCIVYICTSSHSRSNARSSMQEIGVAESTCVLSYNTVVTSLYGCVHMLLGSIGNNDATLQTRSFLSNRRHAVASKAVSREGMNSDRCHVEDVQSGNTKQHP